jgi:hypothetical protein
MMSVRWRGTCTWACLRPLLLYTYPNEKDQGRGNPKGSIQIRSLQRIRLSNAQDIVAEMLGLVKIQHDRFDSGDNVVGINIKVGSVRVQGQAHHAISPPRFIRNHLGCCLLLSRSHGGHGAGGRKKAVGLLGNKHVWLRLRLILKRLLRRRLLELRLLLVVLKKRIRLRGGIKKEIVAGTGGTEWIVFKRIIVGGRVHHGCDRGGRDFIFFLLRVESDLNRNALVQMRCNRIESIRSLWDPGSFVLAVQSRRRQAGRNDDGAEQRRQAPIMSRFGSTKNT